MGKKGEGISPVLSMGWFEAAQRSVSDPGERSVRRSLTQAPMARRQLRAFDERSGGEAGHSQWTAPQPGKVTRALGTADGSRERRAQGNEPCDFTRAI